VFQFLFESTPGIHIFAIVALLIFIVIFTIILIWVIRVDKAYLKYLQYLPLESENQDGDKDHGKIEKW